MKENKIKVFKFGGASIKDAQGFENVGNIVSKHADENLVVIVSALGKTTNKLEAVLEAYYYAKADKNNLLQTLEREHLEILHRLFPEQDTAVFTKIKQLFNELKTRLDNNLGENYDFEYDQIVSFGEIISSNMLAFYLNRIGIAAQWVDARKLIRTNNVYREGEVNWEYAPEKIRTQIIPLLNSDRSAVILSQGFIGGTSEGFTTTLGREGSDFSAAVFGYSLGAESVTIWKDVEGLLNADPKRFSDTVKLPQIPYSEALELAYYGAAVIHPKTIKPLQNKNIPLYVKSFLDPDAEGSRIDNAPVFPPIPPCYIHKDNQVLVSISAKDFSFITQKNIATIFTLFAHHNVKINLMQNSALSCSFCVDDSRHCAELIAQFQKDFFVKYNLHVELFTIRYYDKSSIARITEGKKIILEQKNRTMMQFVTEQTTSD